MEANGELNEEQQEELMDYFDDLTKKNDRERKEEGGAEIPKIDFDGLLKQVNAQINSTSNRNKLEKLLQEKAVILIHSEIPVRRAMDYYEMVRTDKTTEELKKQKEGVNYYNGQDFVFKK